MRRGLLLLLGLLAVLPLVLGAAGAWQAVTSSRSGRDFATFHYAVIEARNPGGAGPGDPYDTAALARRAQAEGTSKGVHPWFYPPPALLPFLWISPPGFDPLPLATSVRLWFLAQLGFTLGVALGLRAWLGVHPVLLALIFGLFSPIPDNLKMGQANLAVLLLVVLGLGRGGAGLLGAAAMFKMAPALHLPALWVAGRRRAAVGMVATAVLLSLLSLPLVPLATQLRFYLEVLPSFSSGAYHGLTVPIDLPANHSLPDLLNQLWPGPDRHQLDARARGLNLLVCGGALVALLVAGRRSETPLDRALLHGGISVLALLAPVYAYEHHLVFALLPLVALGQALLQRRLSRSWWPPLILCYAALAMPLRSLRDLQEALPAAHWWLQESKFFALVGLFLACFAALTCSRNGGEKHGLKADFRA